MRGRECQLLPEDQCIFYLLWHAKGRSIFARMCTSRTRPNGTLTPHLLTLIPHPLLHPTSALLFLHKHLFLLTFFYVSLMHADTFFFLFLFSLFLFPFARASLPSFLLSLSPLFHPSFTPCFTPWCRLPTNTTPSHTLVSFTPSVSVSFSTHSPLPSATIPQRHSFCIPSLPSYTRRRMKPTTLLAPILFLSTAMAWGRGDPPKANPDDSVLPAVRRRFDYKQSLKKPFTYNNEVPFWNAHGSKSSFLLYLVF